LSSNVVLPVCFSLAHSELFTSCIILGEGEGEGEGEEEGEGEGEGEG